MVKKEMLVRTNSLDPEFKTYIAEPIDIYYRKPHAIGVVSYPVYETMNHYWFVIHENGNGAIYQDTELEEVSEFN